MMKKRCCSLLLCACLTAGMVPVSFAAEVQPDYTAVQEKVSGATSGTCGENVTWTLDDEGTLTISGTGEMTDYFGADKGPWFMDSRVRRIVIEEGITHIGNAAFMTCSWAKEVSIPTSVTSIGAGSFSDTGIESITIPDSVQTIGGSCFEGSALTRIMLPSHIKTLESRCFANTKLKTFTISNEVEVLGDNCFSGSALESITIPDTVKEVEESCFYNCDKLTEAKIESVDTKLDGYLFDGCKALTKVTLPEGIQEITTAMFRECQSLESIEIPDSVQTIEDSAFSRSGLTKVVIPDSVTKVGRDVFYDCDELEEVQFSDHLPITYGMFANCYSLKEMDIPEGVPSIESTAFRTSGITVISIPYSVKRIGESAFDCFHLKEVYYGGSEKTLNEIEIADGNDPLYDADIYLAMPFNDVPMDSYYAQPVIWAYQNEITSGIDDTHFAPGRKCTRAQVVTFLWNAAGQPKVDADISFTDVKPGSWYEQAVKWAVSEGVTAGTSATTFSPDATCTRAQVVTFLWNAEGQPQVDATVYFRDVPAGAWYEQAVKWAVSEGVTAGTSATTFSPNATCIRAQVVTFLYNYLAK